MSTATTNIETEKQLVPELRFKGQEDNWESLNLKQLIKDLQSGISVNSEDRPIADDSEFGILKTSSVSDGVFKESENKKIVDEEITRAKLNPTENEIIISRMNTPQLVGESGYIDKTYPNLFVPDRLWQTITYAEKCHNRWLSYFLITDRVRYNLKSIATGTSGTMKNISKPNFLSIKVNCPSLPEQQKIASFLSAVDEKKQQLTKKKELLEQYKKGLMQQLFSGQLRFKDQNGNPYPNWEEKQLIDITKINQGLQIAISERFLEPVEDGYFYITNEFLRAKSKKVFYIKSPPASVICDADDILMTRTGNTGQVVTGVNGAFHNNFFKIKYQDHCEKWFLYYFLTSPLTQHTILKLAGTSTIPDLNHGDFYKIKIDLPSIKEQSKISSVVKSIDTKIEAVNNQITQTQTFKKGLLQQMFV